MPDTIWFERLPVWAIFGGTLLLILASIAAGRRWGASHRESATAEQDSPVGAMVTASLGLLAFILAFTFGMAGTRFEARRHVVVDEANAIGTCFLRAEMLPPPHDETVRKLLREYVDLRIAGPTMTAQSLKAAIETSSRIHDLLWNEAVAAARENPTALPTSLFIQSLNDVIDLHARRLAVSLRFRIPRIIWVALYVLAVLSMSLLGYHAGMRDIRRFFPFAFLAVAFSAVIGLIADIERPQQGLVRVSQEALIDARAGMHARK
jgi:hypothetical protein